MRGLLYWLSQIANYIPFLKRYACPLLIKAGVHTNGNFFFNPFIQLFPFKNFHKLFIGTGSFVNSGTRFALAAPIRIGERVAIGPNVMFETVNHIKDNRRVHDSIPLPIRVEDDVWVGAAAIILPGIHIGKGAVIGAGAVVTKNVEAGTLVAGNPARLIRELDES